jgi:hypothetical protein
MYAGDARRGELGLDGLTLSYVRADMAGHNNGALALTGQKNSKCVTRACVLYARLVSSCT